MRLLVSVPPRGGSFLPILPNEAAGLVSVALILRSGTRETPYHVSGLGLASHQATEFIMENVDDEYLNALVTGGLCEALDCK